ncbi:hypothetical protein PHLH8_24670 [Pseudomonas sp. Pc102]|nr:hypothetical protein PHLH8_24670 [Pseudomonas sp. Pc102]
MRSLLLLMALLLAACNGHGLKLKKDTAVDPLPQIRANLAFTCRHERIPEASADSDLLFKYARWLQKNNQLKQDPAVDAEVERLYRIAAEHQHYKASINLVNGAFRGHFKVRGAERLRLSQEMMEAGVATGYYFVGLFLQRGSAGLREDPELALRYYRKAADEGSALAQALVADKLAPIDIAPDIARQMRRCAAEQGHGDAATDLGVDLKYDKHFQEALEAFQLGAAAGDEGSAGRLWEAFRGLPLQIPPITWAKRKTSNAPNATRPSGAFSPDTPTPPPKSPRSTTSSHCLLPSCRPGTASSSGWRSARPISRRPSPARR